MFEGYKQRITKIILADGVRFNVGALMLAKEQSVFSVFKNMGGLCYEQLLVTQNLE